MNWGCHNRSWQTSDVCFRAPRRMREKLTSLHWRSARSDERTSRTAPKRLTAWAGQAEMLHGNSKCRMVGYSATCLSRESLLIDRGLARMDFGPFSTPISPEICTFQDAKKRHADNPSKSSPSPMLSHRKAAWAKTRQRSRRGPSSIFPFECMYLDEA